MKNNILDKVDAEKKNGDLKYLLSPFFLIIGLSIYTFFYLLLKKQDEQNIVLVMIYLSIVLPMVYLALNRYLFPLLILSILLFLPTMYNFAFLNTESSIGLLITAIIISWWFKKPIQIELYRRKNGLSTPNNIRKNTIIAIVLSLIFPLIWLISKLF